ncbi:hypothetical protein HCU74_14735 [Spongiibacter sp. KMU-166]|uniref:Antitoxin Xre/MbcA/ParS-like toxin-binding domain-containing protein n=1 Tax=Spongiibacter thalassae TaxID=2721624 RepID=A0ABX1GJM2_9GAMM|nr:hypothetical protein [Spongiibacter thalassae]
MPKEIIEIQSSPEASRVVLPVIFDILSKWSFTIDDQLIILGFKEEKVLRDCMEAPEKVELTMDLIERVSLILGIFRSLEIVLPAPHIADAWLNTPNENSVFKGVPPKSHLLSGSIDDLAAVRDFLSYQEHQ